MSPFTWFRSVALFAALTFSLLALLLLSDATARDETKPKKYALLVGVNEYESGKLSLLKYAENDVEKLSELLLDKAKGGFDEVRVLSGARGKKDKADAPTAKNIRAALTSLVKRKKAGEVVLVALSGHGLQLEVADPEEDKTKNKPKVYSYFCPADTDFTDKVSYSSGKCDSLIHVKELFDALDNCGAGSRLVLMDACRNEFKAENITRSLDVESLRVPKGVGVLFGCDAGQKAFETAEYKHGVFFHFVLEALRGKASTNKNNEVTWDELVTYVKREVSETVPTLIGGGARQEPHFLGSLKGKSPVLSRVGGALPEKLVVKDKDTGFEMEFVLIPATGKGGFTMGSTKAEQDAAIADYEKIFGSKASDLVKAIYRAEGPQHKVIITKAFYMGKFEVTQKQYRALTGKNPSWFRADGDGKDSVKGLDTDNFPVEQVSYKDAQDFLDALAKLPAAKEKGLKFRLPTEAEWEYSCRGGVDFEESFNFDGKPSKSISHKDANFNSKYPFGGGQEGEPLNRTCKVGTYPANKFGLHDMHGNVWEWCHDAYDPNAYDAKGRADPSVSKEEGASRVRRGGGWSSSGQDCRAAYRGYSAPSFRFNLIGFRVVQVPVQ